MTRRAGLSTPAFLFSAVIGIAVLITALVAVGTRIDTGPELPPEPSAAEAARQEAASAYAVLADAAEGDVEHGAIAPMARSHEDAVGGVWVPWPEGAPDGATNPPEPQPDTDDVIDLLVQSIAATQQALSAAAPDDAALYASILIRQQAALEQAAASQELPEEDESSAEDDSSEGSAGKPSDSGGAELRGEEQARGIDAEPLTAAQVAALTSQQTLTEFDTARQWLETAAPRLESSGRALQRIADLDGFTSEMLDAGMTDSRSAFAPLPAWFLDEPSIEAAHRLEEDAYRLVARELFTYIPAPDSAVDAQIAATALTFLTPSMRAELSDFPLLEETR